MKYSAGDSKINKTKFLQSKNSPFTRENKKSTKIIKHKAAYRELFGSMQKAQSLYPNTLLSNLAVTFTNRVSLHKIHTYFEYNFHLLKNRHVSDYLTIFWQNFLEAIDVKYPADGRCSRLVSLERAFEMETSI